MIIVRIPEPCRVPNQQPVPFRAFFAEVVAQDRAWLSDAAWRKAFAEVIAALADEEATSFRLTDKAHEKLVKVVESMQWPPGKYKVALFPFAAAICDAEKEPEAPEPKG